MANDRFTAWLSSDERELIEQLARRHATSRNYIVRMAIRVALGLPIPAGMFPALDERPPTSKRRVPV